MGVSDGYVLGTTKVVDHGPDNQRWNLVILGDGYQLSEMDKYHTDVQSFITSWRNTNPLDELFCGMNIYRIDVVSNESGADIPACAGGAPVTKNTYFDATFCSDWNGSPLERLLTIDSTLATNVATSRVPLRHQILCIVNSSKYGGAGGAVAVCSTEASANEIAIHEIGHSAFGLADEYGGNGTGSPAGEPAEPNVTRNTNRATNKWNAFIDPATPMPSACDGGCTSSSCVPPAAPPVANAVGTYEGGAYSDCDIYRPVPSCKMRDLGQPFCPVCSDVIRQTLNAFLPVESIVLRTPSINFQDVPAGMGGIGVTTHRAITWEVVTCRSLTFEITAGPTGGFGTPEGTSDTVSADPILPSSFARIWLSYTSTNAGDSANGNVTVRCLETGQVWMINIIANTISRPNAAVALVLDRSGSMNEDAGDTTTKVQKLREAADTFIGLLQPADGIGVVSFNQTATRLLEITPAGVVPGGAGRVAALGHINGGGMNPSGSTSIGDGVVNGKNMLDDAQSVSTPPPYDVAAMVVLTDGEWNQPPALNTIMGSITSNTFAVGLGLPSNISVPALSTLCQGNDGYLLITGEITPEQSMRLSKYFVQILSGITNAQIAVDPAGILTRDSEHRIPFYVGGADFGMDAILLSPYPHGIEYYLEAPDGTKVTPQSHSIGANSFFVLNKFSSYYRCALPIFPAQPENTHEGLWHAVLRLNKKFAGAITFDPNSEQPATHIQQSFKSIPYEFVTHVYSSLTFEASLAQKSFEVGADVIITAQLREYDRPMNDFNQAWAEITLPDKSNTRIVLSKNNVGEFYAKFNLNQNGFYTIRVRAAGDDSNCMRFERERTLTAVAVPGYDRWDPSEPKPSELCEWLKCLKENKGLSEKFYERMKELGIDPDALMRCCEQKSQNEDGSKVKLSTERLDLNTLNLARPEMEILAEMIAKKIME